MDQEVGGPKRRPPRLGMFMTAILIAACSSPAPGSPDPTDPREIFARALQNTAALRTVHIAVIVETTSPGPSKATYDARGDVDLVNRELALSATSDSGGQTTTSDVVVVNGLIYNRSGDGNWSVSGRPGQDPLAGAPTTAELAGAIEAAIDDPSTGVTLLEPVADCGQAGCHRVQAAVPRAALWRAFRAMLKGVLGDPPLEPPDYVPDVTVDAWVEKGSLRLLQGTNSATIFGTYIELSFVLSRHDAPVEIIPPSGAAPPQPSPPQPGVEASPSPAG